MNNFSELDITELSNINAGVSQMDVATGILGCVFPPFGVFWTIKTTSDWIDEQDW